MAYDNTLTRPEDEEEAPNQGLPPLASVSGGTGGGGFASPGQKKGGGGTGFVNFDRYFNTNAAAAEQMGRHVAGVVEKGADPINQDLDREYDKFADQVKAGYQAGGIERQSDGFYKQNEARYTGPTQFTGEDGFEALKARYQQFGQDVRDAGNVNNIQGVLGKDVGFQQQGQSNYSQGMNAFDANLTARGGQQAFADLQARYANADPIRERQQAASGLVQEAQNRAFKENMDLATQVQYQNEAEQRRQEEERRRWEEEERRRQALLDEQRRREAEFYEKDGY